MKKQLAITLACVALAHSGWCLTANEIIANVQKKYAGLTSLSASGKVITDVDASGVDLASVLPAGVKLPDEAGLQAVTAEAQKPRTITSEFAVRLARPELYSIEWSQEIVPGRANKGVAWSAGDHFNLLIGDRNLMQQTNLDLGLASATGVSGGVAGTLPSMFFQRQTSLVTLLRNVTQLPDEAIGGKNCYVVSGEAAGQKITLWITREFLLKQKRHMLGGAMTFPNFGDDEQLKSTLAKTGQKVTPEAIAQFKQMLQRIQKSSSQMKGSITETYENIQVNQPMNLEIFAHPIPAGVAR